MNIAAVTRSKLYLVLVLVSDAPSDSAGLNTHTVVLHFLPPLHLVCFKVFHKRLHEVFGSRPSGVLAAGVGQGSF